MLSQQLVHRLHQEFLDITVLRGNVSLLINIRKNTNDSKDIKDIKDIEDIEDKTVKYIKNITVNKDNILDKNNPTLDVKDKAFQLRMEQMWKYRQFVNEDKSAVFKLIPSPSSNRYKFFQNVAPPLTSYAYGGIQGWLEKIMNRRLKRNQRFVYERHAILGCDLAAAHFILHRGGKVKFEGHNDWITSATRKILPNKFHPDYKLIAVDASEIRLYYEGLDNFYGLVNLQWLSFRGNPLLDDWCVDKLSSQFPSLLYFDISDCEKVTERALEALYRMNNLKYLIITDYYKTAAFELSCLMLEDCIPGLTCVIRKPQVIPTNEVPLLP